MKLDSGGWGWGGWTYSLSIGLRDIQVPPSPLRARSGRLDDDSQRSAEEERKWEKREIGEEI